MSVTLHVSLLSGRTVAVETGMDVDVETFKRRAQSALKVGKGRLLRSGSTVLDGERTIRECGLLPGDVLNLQIQPLMILTSPGLKYPAFAAIMGDGSVATWGDVQSGGNSTNMGY